MNKMVSKKLGIFSSILGLGIIFTILLTIFSIAITIPYTNNFFQFLSYEILKVVGILLASGIISWFLFKKNNLNIMILAASILYAIANVTIAYCYNNFSVSISLSLIYIRFVFSYSSLLIAKFIMTKKLF